MENIKTGRITLAFTFILLGIVIFLEKFLHYGLINLLSILWTVVIIIFGLEIIYKPKVKLDWISTSLIILFVIIIGGTTAIDKYHPDIKEVMNAKYRYSEDISEQVILNKKKKLIIDESNIDIVINKSNYKNIKIILESIYEHNDNEKKLDDKLKLINVEDNGETTTISRYLKKKREYKKVNIKNKRYLIYLPSGIDLEVRNKHGNVSLALPREQAGKFNIVATYGRIYDELEFNIIESASKVRINEFRKSMKPEYSIRVNNGDVIIETN